MSFYIFISKIQLGKTPQWAKLICLTNILSNAIHDDWFDQIRTKEMFGYIVGTSKHDFGPSDDLSKYFVFTIQSANKQLHEMITRTQQFITDFHTNLLALNQDQFQTLIEGCIAPLEAPFANLQEKMSFTFSNEIDTKYLKCDLRETLIETYKTLTISDIIAFYETYFINRKSAIVGICCR